MPITVALSTSSSLITPKRILLVGWIAPYSTQVDAKSVSGTVQVGDRVAQLIIEKIETPDVLEVDVSNSEPQVW